MLLPMLPAVTDSLLNLAVIFTDEVLSLILETLAMVLGVRPPSSSLSFISFSTVQSC